MAGESVVLRLDRPRFAIMRWWDTHNAWKQEATEDTYEKAVVTAGRVQKKHDTKVEVIDRRPGEGGVVED